jgi:hypothetical protein
LMGLLHHQTSEETTQMLMRFLSKFVQENYKSRDGNPDFIHSAMKAVVPAPEHTMSTIFLPNEAKKDFSGLENIQILGWLDSRRIILSGKIQECIGIKYSAFRSVMLISYITASSEAEWNAETVPLVEYLGKPFKPQNLSFSCSLRAMLAERTTDQDVYNVLLPSMMTDRLKSVLPSQIPTSLYGFTIGEMAKWVHVDREYTVIVSVSSDTFYLLIQIFSSKSKKLLLRHTHVVHGTFHSVVDMMFFDRTTLGLVGYSKQYVFLTFCLRKRRATKLLTVDDSGQGIRTIFTKQGVYTIQDPYRCIHYGYGPNYSSLVKKSEIILTATGQISEITKLELEPNEKFIDIPRSELRYHEDGYTQQTTKVRNTPEIILVFMNHFAREILLVNGVTYKQKLIKLVFEFSAPQYSWMVQTQVVVNSQAKSIYIVWGNTAIEVPMDEQHLRRELVN